VVVPLVVTALATGAGGELLVGTLVASVVAVVAYAGIFVALGLVVRRALVWGIVYLLIWEDFIARAGTSSSRLSVQYYARSLLADLTDVPLRLSGASTVAAVVVPLLAAGLGVAFTAWRLRRMSVA
jgi:ABC-2 type transport system permease protein